MAVTEGSLVKMPGVGAGGGMEHANSTAMSSSSAEYLPSLAAHEFFHLWNVKRIRPKGLEPWDYDRANMTDGLWIAEGFTQYYGPLLEARAGVSEPRSRSWATPVRSTVHSLNNPYYGCRLLWRTSMTRKHSRRTS